MLLYVLLFNYAPLWGWINAFRDISNERGTLIPFLSGQTPAWYGIKNFTNLFSANAITFQETLRNTLAMSLINLVFGTVSAIVLAVLLNEVRQKSFKRTVQTVTYLPHFLSMIIVVGMAQIIFDSSYNKSVVLDYEQRLIKCCTTDSQFQNILNRNKGQQNACEMQHHRFGQLQGSHLRYLH